VTLALATPMGYSPPRMSDQITDRKAKLEKLRALGVDPFGERFADVTSNAEIRAAAKKLDLQPGQVGEDAAARFRAAGRVVLYRDIGSLIFLTVRDWTGELQFGLSKKMLQGSMGVSAEVAWKVAKLLDLGDIVGVDGQLGRTKTGELTLWVNLVSLLSKALRPPPEKCTG